MSWYQDFILLNWNLLPLDATGLVEPQLEDDPEMPTVGEGEREDWAASLACCRGGRFGVGRVVRRRCFRSLYCALLMTIKRRPSLMWNTLPTHVEALGDCTLQVEVLTSQTFRESLFGRKSLSPVLSGTARRCSSFQNGETPMIIQASTLPHSDCTNPASQ